MKTALQELKSKLIELDEMGADVVSIEQLIHNVDILIEKEKQQIEEAYRNGAVDGSIRNKSAELYYNEKYGGEK
ncbi:MAG TPA: hypothetical protein V6C58_04140 [Allocoleopsis sp.]